MNRQRLPIYLLIATLGLFAAGRFLGMGPLAHSWSFAHWATLPIWYPIAWLVGSALVGAIIYALANRDIPAVSSRLAAFVGLALLGAIFILLRFDSFVYGGGNLRIRDLAQVDRIIPRWYEWLTIFGASVRYHVFLALGLKAIPAAVMSYRAIGLGTMVISLLGVWVLVRHLTQGAGRRFPLFLVALFGAQALLLFNFIGVEVVIPPVIIWFAVLAARYIHKPMAGRYLALWGLFLLGLVLNVSLIFLLPALIFVTLTARSRKGASPTVPWLAALATLAALLVIVFWRAYQSLEFATHVLLFKGKLPFSDYGLFSPRHLSEWLQLLFLGAPLLIAAIGLSWWLRGRRALWQLRGALWLATIGGLVVTFVLDPNNGITLDYPRLVAYFTPVSLLVAVLLASAKAEELLPATLPLAATAAIAIVAATVPPYLSIRLAEPYTEVYLDQHDVYYRTACLAFRDSYAYARNWDEATRWERLLPVKSPDYMLLRGSDNLRMNKEYEDAVNAQYQIVAKFPYWAEPRALLAGNLMTVGRYNLAKPQIDTCLLLEPYEKDHYVNLYTYYRGTGDFPAALRAVNEARFLAPHDTTVVTDQMILIYRNGDLARAKQLADSLLTLYPNAPYPTLIEAFYADKNQDPHGALQLYKKFVQLAPNEAEVPKVKSRIDMLETAFAPPPALPAMRPSGGSAAGSGRP